MNQSTKRLGRSPRLEKLEGRICLSGMHHVPHAPHPEVIVANSHSHNPPPKPHPRPSIPTLNGSLHGTFAFDSPFSVSLNASGVVRPLGRVQTPTNAEVTKFGPMAQGVLTLTNAGGTTVTLIGVATLVPAPNYPGKFACRFRSEGPRRRCRDLSLNRESRTSSSTFVPITPGRSPRRCIRTLPSLEHIRRDRAAAAWSSSPREFQEVPIGNESRCESGH